MGSLRKLRSGTWEARWYGPDGRQHSKNFKLRGDANRYMRAMEGAKVRGDYLDPRLGRTPFRDVAAEWLKTTGRARLKTQAGYQSILKTHLLPAFGSTPVSRIDAAKIDVFLAELNVSPATARNVLRVLSPIMQHAVKARMIPRNPVVDANRPKVAKPRPEEMRILTPEQVAELVDAVPECYQTRVLFAAYTGLRAGEISALRVKDVDPFHRRVTVRESVSDVNGTLHLERPKNGKTRTLPLAKLLVVPITEQMAGKGKDDFLFGPANGRMFRHGNFMSRHYRPAVRRLVAEGTWPEELSGFRFHDLRHTCASILIREGANIVALSRFLGHSGIQITVDRYGHLYPDELQKLADALDRAYASGCR